MHASWLLLVLLLGAGTASGTVPDPVGRGMPSASYTAKPCPPPHRNGDLSVRLFLSSPLLPEMRARFNLGTASIDDVQLLKMPEAGLACAALWRAVEENGTELSPGDHVSFYRSGDRFFVPIRRPRPTRPGTIQIDGRSSLDVYDSEYRLVGRFAA
jgi:hypothetical protein